MSISSEMREHIMQEWDKWRRYIARGGGGSWPRDAFESLLDYLEEEHEKVVKDAFQSGYRLGKYLVKSEPGQISC